MRSKKNQSALVVLALAVVTIGCATKKYVQQEVGATEEKTAERIEVMQSQIENAEMTLAEHDQRMSEISGTAKEALERAVAAGKLAEGKFVFERVLADDDLQFDFDRADLSEQAEQALDGFAEELRERNEELFIEIQGHTDSTGSENYNLRLGQARAESVRRYLNAQHGLPLHRLSVISYGETSPIAENDTREERSRNRRVALVVLK